MMKHAVDVDRYCSEVLGYMNQTALPVQFVACSTTRLSTTINRNAYIRTVRTRSFRTRTRCRALFRRRRRGLL